MIDQPFERTIEAFLAGEAPDRIPADLHGGIVDRARTTAQRRPLVRLWPWIGASRRLLLVGAAAVLTIGASILLWAGGPAPVPVLPSPTRAPTTSQAAEAPPSPATRFDADLGRLTFSYVPPGGQAGLASHLFFSWASRGNGMTIVVLDRALVHPCDGTGDFIDIRTDAAGLFEDLRTISHARLGTPSATSVDGHPALVADYTVDPACGIDVHDSPSHLVQPRLTLRYPARLTALEVDGNELLIIAYAPNVATLPDWLPVAQQFIDSLQFAP